MKNYKKQIYLFLYISLFIVISSFAVLFFNFRKQVRLQNEILKINMNLIQADSLINNLLQIESDKRGFQITREVYYLKNFYTIKVNCNINIANLKKNIIADSDKKIISEIEPLLQLRIVNLDSGVVVFVTRGFDASVKFMQLKGKKNIRELLNQKLELLKNNLLQKLGENTSGINKRSNQNLTGLLILLSIFIMLMLVAARTFRLAQKKIIKNHFKFNEAQRIAKIGSWEWDIVTNKITWSREQFRLFGEDRKTFDLTYEGYLSHLSEKEQEHTKALVKYALEGKANYTVEHEIKRKDGTSLMVFEQGTVLFDENNKPTGMFGTTQDITERKRADGELLETQKKFKEIFNNSADGIYQSTIDGRFIMANPSMARIFGYDSPDDLLLFMTDIGEQLYADPADRKRMTELLSKQGHIENFEVQLLKKNKDIVWVSESTRIVRDEKYNISYFEGTLKDITERKKAEEQLLHLSNRLQLAIQATSIGIWDWDIANNNTVWDEEMYHIYNVDPKDSRTITEAWEAAVHPEDFERVNLDLQMAIKGDKVYDTGFRIVWKDKSIHYVKGNAFVQRDQYGNALRMIGTNTDITERKEAEEKILELNKSLDQFANITAHDLQEPIRMVSGFLGLLEKKYSDVIDKDGKSYIYRAKDGADRMSILIKDLLEFSRSGNKAAKKEPVDFSIVMDLVKKDLSIVMTETGATLFIPESLPVVTGTQSALYRLVLNLISNGIKFRKKDTAPEVTLTVKELPDCWEFNLQDNGIGVAEKDQPKLFQAFQRLHRRDEYPGTGLGLVTCKKIVETHGGKIWMTSEQGKGTAFHFTISKTQ